MRRKKRYYVASIRRWHELIDRNRGANGECIGNLETRAIADRIARLLNADEQARKAKP